MINIATFNFKSLQVTQENNRHRISLLITGLFLLFCLQTESIASSQPDRNWLRLTQSKEEPEKHDLRINSIGALSLGKDMVGHIDLTSIRSDINGDAWTLDFGGGYAFNWDISLYVSLGVALGYNTDASERIAAYYPEAGAVLELSRKLGLTISAKRYHRLYDETERVVLVGLVFRN